jgi:hypothetical protein
MQRALPAGRLLALAALLQGAISSVAVDAAEPVDKVLELLERRPEGMSQEAWRAQRREAARELGRKRDRRAVPALLEIVAKERFDVLLENAIDALGEIGDPRAVAPLEKLRQDPALDVYVRDAIASALRKLGRVGGGGAAARPAPPVEGLPPRPSPLRPVFPKHRPPESTEAPILETPAEPKLVQPFAIVEVRRNIFGPLPPIDTKLDDDVLSSADRIGLALGSAGLEWDGGGGQTSSSLGVKSQAHLALERRRWGLTVDGGLDVAFGLTSPSGAGLTYSIGHQLAVEPELRLYPFKGALARFFAQVAGGAGYALTVAKQPSVSTRRLSFAGRLAIGGGVGYGRIMSIGARLRARRIQEVLRQANLLVSGLPPEVVRRLGVVWYRLRSRLGTFSSLGYTLELLRDAGLLTDGAVDPATMYRLLRILDDAELDDRPHGTLLRLGYGYARSLIKDDDDVTSAFVYATAEYAYQLDPLRSFDAKLRFFYDMWGSPDFYGVEASASYAHRFYGENLDPIGTLSASVKAGVSDQPGSSFSGGGLGYRILGGLGFLRCFGRGLCGSLGIEAGVDTGGGIVLLSLETRLGLVAAGVPPPE